jgi:hypothetical protein
LPRPTRENPHLPATTAPDAPDVLDIPARTRTSPPSDATRAATLPGECKEKDEVRE